MPYIFVQRKSPSCRFGYMAIDDDYNEHTVTEDASELCRAINLPTDGSVVGHVLPDQAASAMAYIDLAVQAMAPNGIHHNKKIGDALASLINDLLEEYAERSFLIVEPDNIRLPFWKLK